jgi:hypothetical protein
LAVPALCTNELEITAVNFVLLTKLVVCTVPFHSTIELVEKFDPFTVRVTPTPAVVLAGEMELSTGRIVWARAQGGTANSRMVDANESLSFVIAPPMRTRREMVRS